MLSVARLASDAGPVQAWRAFAAEFRHRTTGCSDVKHPAPSTTPPAIDTRLSETGTMSSIIARSAFRAAPRLRASPVTRRWASAAAEGEREAGKQALQTGAKRDPELYVCSRL
jgi:hypothetical protein